MKVLITESQLDTYVFKTLDEMFPEDEVHYVAPYEYDDETGAEYEDDSRVLFYLGDYEDGDNDIFKWYDCGYFNPGSSAQDICPTVVIEHPYDDRLIAYFGDKWEEPFKKWFTKNFDLPVKTVEWKRMIG